MLNRGQWFQAHIVGQSLINIGDSCRVLETEVPATIQDLYIRAYVTQATNDLGQERYFVSKGLAGLGWVKEHAGENPAYAKLYDDMEPRFLELQQRMQWQR